MCYQLKKLKIIYDGKIKSKYENAKMIKYDNDELKELSKKIGLDFHYELHINESSAFIRFDCHCVEYNDFINMNKETYLNSIPEKSKKRRDILKEKFKETFPEYKMKQYRYNYLSLIKKNLDKNNVLKEANDFVEETLDIIIEILKKI